MRYRFRFEGVRNVLEMNSSRIKYPMKSDQYIDMITTIKRRTPTGCMHLFYHRSNSFPRREILAQLFSQQTHIKTYKVLTIHPLPPFYRLQNALPTPPFVVSP